MAKQVKDQWVGMRSDKAFKSMINDYIHAAEIDMADLLRSAVTEYMVNHPIKQPTEPSTIKPGA